MPGAETVSSVWVLYPGTEFVFYDVARGRIVDLPEATGALTGVGAIPLAPGQDMSELIATLGRLLG